MVRRGYNLMCWLRNRQLVKVALLESPHGIRKLHLALKVGLSRPTVDAHIKEFLEHQQVVEIEHLFFWKHNYEEILREHAREKERLRRRNRIEDKIFMEFIDKVSELKTLEEIDEFDSEKFMRERRAHYAEEK